MKALLDAGLLHGDCLTVTGRTMAENLAHIARRIPDGKALRAHHSPSTRTGGITILHGSLAPGAVVKAGLRRVRRHRKGFSSGSELRWTRWGTAPSPTVTSW